MSSLVGDVPSAESLLPPSSYRPEIDGLRAVAVIAVIINHFSKNLLPSGYLGVDIFFVISGLVITSSLEKGRGLGGFFAFLSGFYKRRIKRIIPALLGFVVVMAVLICLFDPDPRLAIRTGISSIFGLSNIYLFKQSVDYFAPSTELNPFTHTWSLGVEEQFYFVFPLLYWFSGYGAKRLGGERLFAGVLFVLAVLSLLLFVGLYPHDQSAAYFLMPSRFWELAAGSLVFLGLKNWGLGRKISGNTIANLSFVLLVAIFFAPASLAVPSTLAAVAASMLLVLSMNSVSGIGLLLSTRFAVHIGLISYSLYLWHWGVLAISRWTIGIHGSTVLFQVALMYILACLSFHWLETPARKSKAGALLVAGAAACVGAICAGFLLLLERSSAALYAGQRSEQFVRTWWKDESGKRIDACHVDQFKSRDMERCLSRSPSPSRGYAFLFGDSNARNYLPVVKALFPGGNVRYLTTSGCSLTSPFMSRSLNPDPSCRQYNNEVASFLRQRVMQGDVVFIGQRLYGVESVYATHEYFRFIADLAGSLAHNSVPLVLFDGVSPPASDPRMCTREVWRPAPSPILCTQSRDLVLQRYADFDRLARAYTEHQPNLFFVPLRDGLCVGRVCGQRTVSGTPIWHDVGHITEQAAAELAPLARRRLSANLIAPPAFRSLPR